MTLDPVYGPVICDPCKQGLHDRCHGQHRICECYEHGCLPRPPEDS